MLRMDGRLTRLPLLGYQEHLPGADNVYRHIDSELGFRCTDGGVRFRRRFAGNLIAFRNLFVGSILTGILFAAMFVVWNYYPHPTIPLPIVTAYTSPS